MSPTSRSPTEDELDRERFGTLMDIPPEALVRLAIRIANSRLKLHLPSPGGNIVSTLFGSSNLVHVVELTDGTKLVIRLPATGGVLDHPPEAAAAMQSQAATLNLIREKTTVPVPEVYEVDLTADNEVGAPYFCMSFIPGKPVSNVWFVDDEDPATLSREEMRLRILKGLAQEMAKFSPLVFDKMGSITTDESGSIVVGPMYDSDENENGSLVYTSSGPFDSYAAFLEHHTATDPIADTWKKAQTKIMGVMMGRYMQPHAEDGPPGFVLCPPDFDSQNVMVDGKGNVTGIIDWDDAYTMPRLLGYVRYPSWITRDWDPIMYGWPHMPDSEDSPETLARYRDYYKTQMGEALAWQGDCVFTEKSHIAEAVWIAALVPISRLEICRKFVQVCVGDDVNALDVLDDIGCDEYEEEKWSKLEDKLRQLGLRSPV